MKVLLFVFFIMASLVMSKINGMTVAPPNTLTNPKTPEQDLTLTIKGDGSIFLNKTATTLETLPTLLACEMHNHQQDVVVVNADESANYGLVVKAMNKARQIGVRKFVLAADPDSGL